jgi:hypothetical protein
MGSGEENKIDIVGIVDNVDNVERPNQLEIIKKLQEENILLRKKLDLAQSLQSPLWFYDRELANIHYDKLFKLKSEIDIRLFLLEPYTNRSYSCVTISLFTLLVIIFIFSISSLGLSWTDVYEILIIFYTNLMGLLIVYLITDFAIIYIKSKKIEKVLQSVKSFYTINNYDMTFLIYYKQ